MDPRILLMFLAATCSTEQGQRAVPHIIGAARSVYETTYCPLLLTAVGAYALDKLVYATTGKKLLTPLAHYKADEDPVTTALLRKKLAQQLEHNSNHKGHA